MKCYYFTQFLYLESTVRYPISIFALICVVACGGSIIFSLFDISSFSLNIQKCTINSDPNIMIQTEPWVITLHLLTMKTLSHARRSLISL